MSFRHAAFLGTRLLGMLLIVMESRITIDAAHEAWVITTRSNLLAAIATCVPFLAGLLLFFLSPTFARRMDRAVARGRNESPQLTFGTGIALGAMLIGMREIVVSVPGLITSLQTASSASRGLFPGASVRDPLFHVFDISAVLHFAGVVIAGAFALGGAPHLARLASHDVHRPADKTEAS